MPSKLSHKCYLNRAVKYHVTPTSDVNLVPKSFSHWWIERRKGNRESDIVLLVPQISKVAKIQHSRRVYECISYPQIRPFERNGSSLSEDTDTTSRIRYQNTLRYVRHTLKSRPMSEACPFWVAWGPGDKNEIMFKKGCRDTNEGHCSIEPSNALSADALVTSL